MKIKPYDPTKPWKPRTKRQDEQFRLARVRGFWFHAYTLTGDRQKAMQKLVDEELTIHGQEAQTVRVDRQQSELRAQLLKEHQ
jgi:IS1 family transposase